MSEPDRAYLASQRADRGSLEAQQAATARAQRRLARRYPLPAQITVEYVRGCKQMHEQGRRFWVETRDVSANGISFYHRETLFYGEQIRLELRMGGGQLCYVTAWVVRCHRREDGTFEVGAAFKTKEAMPPPAEPKFAVPDGADV